MNVYLDTSILLRRALRQKGAISDWSNWTGIYTSVLMRVEALRVLDRLRLEGLMTDEHRATLREELQTVCDSVTLVNLSEYILDRASQSFPTVLGTLDAIHLATAFAVKEQEAIDLTLVTHDEQLARAARGMGMAVEGV